MKASEYIKQLECLIAEHGDKELFVLGTYRFEKATGPHYVSEGTKDPKYQFLHEPDDYIHID